MNRLLVLVVCFFPLFAFSQMVNIESHRMHTDTIRLTGNCNLGFSYQENNASSLLVTKSAVALQYKNKNLKNIFMVLANYDLSRSGTEDFSNSAFTHLRYNRKLNSWLRWEVFTQVQYNRLLSVGVRALAGTGPRFKWLAKEKMVSYVGTLYMYEYEETTESIVEIHRHHRLSSYLTVSASVPKIKGEFVSTTYFQPRFDKMNDFRILQQTGLHFNITKHFRWNTGFSFLYDAYPPQGVQKRALSFDQGFRIEF